MFHSTLILWPDQPVPSHRLPPMILNLNETLNFTHTKLNLIPLQFKTEKSGAPQINQNK